MSQPEFEAGDAATDSAWGVFADCLMCGLRQLDDGEVLALIAPTGAHGRADQMVIRVDRHRGGIWVSRGVAGSTAAEWVIARTGTDGTAELAQTVVDVARIELGLPHPQLFTAGVIGDRAARLAEDLGLRTTGHAPGSEPARDPHDVAYGGPESLRPLVAAVVRDVTDGDPVVDDDGDLRFEVDGTTCFVLFERAGASVQLFSMVVRGIYSRRNTAVEVDLLNRKDPNNTWFMIGRDVYLRSTVPARPLSAENLDRALRIYIHELGSVREELAYRLGGAAA